MTRDPVSSDDGDGQAAVSRPMPGWSSSTTGPGPDTLYIDYGSSPDTRSVETNPPVLYDFCVVDPTSRLLTMGLMPI